MNTSVFVTALVRHLLTALAGAAAVKYGVDGEALDAVVGGVAAAAGIGWSFYEKHSSGKATR